ncbi:MAG TPA: hypothetical protein V6D21_24255 [Candidatus Obscuribacterales bacterium]|jgi:hypothetical protein
MRVIKTTVLSVILMATSSLGLIAIAQNRWPEGVKRGRCPVGQTCSYPTDGDPRGSRYCAPSNQEAIGGFYVDLDTPDSSAVITWFLDNGQFGSKNIVSSQNGQNWVSFGNPGVQCFNFTFQPMPNNGTRVDFKFNFDANRR